MKTQPSKYYLRLDERKIRNPSQRKRRQEERRSMNNRLRAMTVAGTVAAVTVLAGCGIGGEHLGPGEVFASQAAPTAGREQLYGGSTEQEIREGAESAWSKVVERGERITVCSMWGDPTRRGLVRDAILTGYEGDPWVEKYWVEYRNVLEQECN